MNRNSASLAPFLNSAFGRYGAAITATAVALAAIAPFVHESIHYIVLFPAVAFSALFCGVGPATLAIVLGLLGTRFWFLTPAHSLSVPDPPQLIGIFTFLAASSIVVLIGGIQRRNQQALLEFQKNLESRFQERTAELHTANQNVGDLTGRLLHLQDEERRRIARELHDSVGQSLAALSMNLASFGAAIEHVAKVAGKVSDSTSLVNDISTEIRTISHLLHPPLLDEAGLASALRWYIAGFTERSKIRVDLELPDDFDRLPRDLETAVFRLVQESLTNVHRHSESAVARIRLTRSADGIRLEVEDEGKGISPQQQMDLLSGGTPGVGIRGMRERLRQLGGTLEITSNGTRRGTKIVAKLTREPLARAATAGSAT